MSLLTSSLQVPNLNQLMPMKSGQKRKMLIISNSQPYYSECGGYCLQMHYLFRMFCERFEIYYYSIGLTDIEENKVYDYNSFLNHLMMTNEVNASKLKNVADNRKYIQDLKFVAHRFSETIFINLDRINNLIASEKIDTTFFLGDVVIFSKNETVINCKNSYCWYPCHYDPIPSGDIKGLNMFKNVICLSPSLYKMIMEKKKANLIKNSIQIHYLPHVVKHVTITNTKNELRRKYNIPEDKWVVFVNATFYEDSERKNPEGTLVAFKEFLKTHPNSMMVIHSFLKDKVRLKFIKEVTLPQNVVPGKECEAIVKFGADEVKIQFIADMESYPGKVVQMMFEKDLIVENKIPYPVDNLIEELGLKDHVIYHQDYLTYDELMEFYVLSDVLLCASYAEGFGVPVLEAQLYGLPVITTGFMAMKDYNFNGYVIDKFQRKFNKGQHAFWVMPYLEGIVEGLNYIYENGVDEGRNILAQRIIQSTMSYDAVSNEWNKIVV